jgi:hypothetical protein
MVTTYIVKAYSRRKKRGENRYTYYWKDVKSTKNKADAIATAQELSRKNKGEYIVMSLKTEVEFKDGYRKY